MPVSVLVVCLGNICRSPMGEAVLAHVAAERGLDIDVASAGTANYHVGEEPDERTTAVCRKHGVPIDHEARAVSTSDFKKYTYILACDENNLRNLNNMRPKDHIANVRLWGSFVDNKPIADPYYGPVDGFESVYRQCLIYSHKFLDSVFGPSESAREGNGSKPSL